MQRRDFLRNGLMLGTAGILPGMGLTSGQTAEPPAILESALSDNTDLEIAEKFYNAISEERVDVIEALIRNGADVNVKDEYGRTPLRRAAQFCQKKIVELLIANGADVNAADSKYGATPLFQAVMNGDIEVVKILVAAGADVKAKTKDGYTPLCYAVVYNDTAEIVEFLIVNGADVNIKDNDCRTPLYYARERLDNEREEASKKEKNLFCIIDCLAVT